MEYIVDELNFDFDFQGVHYEAYVRVYNDGSKDVEVVYDDAVPDLVQEHAELEAMRKGIF